MRKHDSDDHATEPRGGHHPTPGGKKGKQIEVVFQTAKEDKEKHEHVDEIGLWVFNDQEELIASSPVGKQAKVKISGDYLHRMVTVLQAPINKQDQEVTIELLRKRLASEERLLLNPKVVLGPVRTHLWKTSCCRVRGKVVMEVTLPNGTVQERPLCGGRVTIYEVDTTLRRLVFKIPNDLLFRMRREWLVAIEEPAESDGPLSHEAIREGLRMSKASGMFSKASSLIESIKGITSPAELRLKFVENIDLLRPYWCRFSWLDRYYTISPIKTVPLNEDGTFDTTISYYCLGDHPDLYFKVEQDCHSMGWKTVHAPSVHCNTHWDYCCGKFVKIKVTHPYAIPGKAPVPWEQVFVSATDPARIGSWEVLSHTSGVFAVHAAVLHTGKVLLFSGTAERNLVKESRVWDPVTDTMTTQTFPEDLFCAGHALLADGQVLVNGGSNNPGQGIRSTFIFDPVAETWRKVGSMEFGRWYPTTITLPDGRILTFSGRANGPPIVELEVFDPATESWTKLPATANKDVPIYPSLHVMHDGKIFYTGTRWDGNHPWPAPPQTALLDLTTNTWADVGPHVVPNRTEGFSVLLPPLPYWAEGHDHGDVLDPHRPPTFSRVLVFGGPGDMRSAEIIDLSEDAPAWRRIADSAYPRINANAVILPDGNVLACSGIDGHKFSSHNGSLTAEIFNSITETWHDAAAMSVKRHYHSVSILLPDGRVLNTGSENLQMSMEIYSPPYLFRGPRPKITSSPLGITYGTKFEVESPDACRVMQVVLVRTSSITHHTNTDQRLVPLHFHMHDHCMLRITSPASGNVAPPGYYMLFLLDDYDVPSVASFIRVS